MLHRLRDHGNSVLVVEHDQHGSRPGERPRRAAGEPCRPTPTVVGPASVGPLGTARLGSAIPERRGTSLPVGAGGVELAGDAATEHGNAVDGLGEVLVGASRQGAVGRRCGSSGRRGNASPAAGGRDGEVGLGRHDRWADHSRPGREDVPTGAATTGGAACWSANQSVGHSQRPGRRRVRGPSPAPLRLARADWKTAAVRFCLRKRLYISEGEVGPFGHGRTSVGCLDEPVSGRVRRAWFATSRGQAGRRRSEHGDPWVAVQ